MTMYTIEVISQKTKSYVQLSICVVLDSNLCLLDFLHWVTSLFGSVLG